ncbi:PREDICTED: protein S100-A8 [Chinchilla lanigera]|uniref:Protein S100 n=1 Tax=Chinchilla lanigera TaxID=34839 RepID=A0A8C2YK65_CHILA|nr:PREDICTED: protein S100-A8 [Chinchilla lanigera]XP_013365429.1 PREDICTED: protein S100-A8 [Chinchilla lanigera]
MQTELEKALNNIITVYHKYSLEKGNHHAVYKDDLKKLLTTECPQYTKKKTADEWFKQLDVNEDGAINFQEFLVLVVKVALRAHEESHKH